MELNAHELDRLIRWCIILDTRNIVIIFFHRHLQKNMTHIPHTFLGRRAFHHFLLKKDKDHV